MESLGFVVGFLVLWCTSVNAVFYDYSECTKDDHPPITNVTVFKIEPDPILMTQNMSITTHINLIKEIPEGTIVKVNYYKIKSIFRVNVEIPIPCFLGRFGSCTRDFCQYLELFEEEIKGFFPEGVKPSCPLKPGYYGGDNVQVKIPEMGAIARFFIGGQYRAELEVIMDKRPVACFKVMVEAR